MGSMDIFYPHLSYRFVNYRPIVPSNNYEMHGTFIFERIFAPFIMSGIIAFLIFALIPRGKIFALYFVCSLYVGFVLLGMVGVFFFPSGAGGIMSWRELVQCLFGLIGSISVTHLLVNDEEI